jgi:hypothetical protein
MFNSLEWEREDTLLRILRKYPAVSTDEKHIDIYIKS